MNIVNILMNIHKNEELYVNIKSYEVGRLNELLKEHLPKDPKIEDYEKLPPLEDMNIYKLPTYEEINHKDIMLFYAQEMVEDKNLKKELLSILRYKDYMDKFYDALKKHNLYEDYEMVAKDIYLAIYDAWEENIKNSRKSKKKSKG